MTSDCSFKLTNEHERLHVGLMQEKMFSVGMFLSNFLSVMHKWVIYLFILNLSARRIDVTVCNFVIRRDKHRSDTDDRTMNIISFYNL